MPKKVSGWPVDVQPAMPRSAQDTGENLEACGRNRQRTIGETEHGQGSYLPGPAGAGFGGTGRFVECGAVPRLGADL